AGDVQRAALAGDAGLGGLVLRMQAAHADLAAEWRQQQPVTGRDPARMDGASHDEAGAGEGEGAIDGEPEAAVVTPRAGPGSGACKNGVERIDSVAAMGRDRDHLGSV